MTFSRTSFLLVVSLSATLAFQAPSLSSLSSHPTAGATVTSQVSTALGSSRGGSSSNANNDQEFMRWAKQSRSAGATDNVVELLRPLGLVLNEDKRTGNVYVETVAPNGNAARTGKVSRTSQGWSPLEECVAAQPSSIRVGYNVRVGVDCY
jgi:hypothetical protein